LHLAHHRTFLLLLLLLPSILLGTVQDSLKLYGTWSIFFSSYMIVAAQ
jgi:hypothetical protein